MGFFDSVGGFFTNTIPGFFGDVVHGAETVVTVLHDDVKSVFGGIKDVSSSIVEIPKTIVNGGKDIVVKAEDVVGNVTSKTIDVVDHVGGEAVTVVGNTAKGITDFLGSPSFLLIAACGLYILTNR